MNRKEPRIPFYHKFVASFVVLVCLAIGARADIIDPTFNTNIQTSTYLTKWVSYLAVRPDGKIWASGYFNRYNGLPVGKLIRLNADASIDTTFDNNQITEDSSPYVIQPLPSGKILVGGDIKLADGTTFTDRIIRLNEDGSLDSSFDCPVTGDWAKSALDSTGRVYLSGALQYPLGGNTVQRRILRLTDAGAVDPSFDAISAPPLLWLFSIQDQKIVFSDYDSGAQQYRILRLTETGAPDPSFTATLVGNFWIAQVVALTGGKILVLSDTRVVRINPDGGIDPMFQIPPNFPTQASRLIAHPDGKITYDRYINGPNGRKVTRLLSNGAPDAGFPPFNHFTEGSPAMALQPNGGLLLGDEDAGTAQNRFLRLHGNGTIDTEFNPGGTGFQRIAPGKIRTITTLAGSDMIMIGGAFDLVNGVVRPKVARLKDNSTLDETFQLNMSPSGNYFSAINDAYNITLETGGKLLVSGNFSYLLGTSQKLNVVRLNPNGDIDGSFALGPLIDDLFASTGLGTNKSVLRSDGKILVGTSRNTIQNPTRIPLLLDASGAQDNSFTSTVFDGKNLVAIFDVFPTGDGKVWISGVHRVITPTTDIKKGFLVRLNLDGTPDPSFQMFELLDKEVSSFVVLPNNQVVVAARANNQSFVYRLNDNGAIDESFISGEANGRINAVSLLPDGRILIGGIFAVFNAQTRTNLALLETNGRLGVDVAATNGAVFCITIDSRRRALVGGEFTSIRSGGEYAIRPYVARLNLPVASPVFDYDGDRKTDYSVFRPSSGAWYLQRSTAGFQGLQFGTDGDKLTPADYDGDGKTDIAVYRPSAGQWYILNSSNGTVSYPVFGVAEDLPAPGDYDGDGKADLAVFRPSQGTWYRQNSSNGSFFGMQFGSNGDVPTVGDFDGDGKNDLGIFRPSVGDWYNIRSSNGSVFGERFGQTGDKIAPADYDGDGKTDIAIFRPSTGLWVVRNSATGTYSYHVFGAPADIPISGDYDGDGKADIGVWRPSDGTWYIQRSDNGQFIVFPWGQNGDVPTPSAYGN